MKILFFSNIVPRSAGVIPRLMGAIARRGRDFSVETVAIIPCDPGSNVKELWREAGLAWDILPEWTDKKGREHPWAFFSRGITLLKRHKPDVVVVHFGNEIPSVALILMARILGLGSMRWIWIQDQQICDPSPVARKFSRLRMVSWVFDHIIAVYEGGKLSMLKRGIPSSRVTVIYNGVQDYSLRRSPGWLRKDLGLSDQTVIIMTIGSLIARKRIEFLLRAIEQLLPSRDNGLAEDMNQRLRFLVIGDGPERVSLEDLARKKGVSEIVRFMGYREDARDLLLEADVYVHAATAEACSYAVLEAMCAGKPVLVTNAGAAMEQVKNGDTGIVINVGDEKDFVNKLVWLIGDFKSRERMGDAARRRWNQLFRLDDTARKYIDVFRSLVQGG